MKIKYIKRLCLFLMVCLAFIVGILLLHPKETPPSNMKTLDSSLANNVYYLSENNYEQQMHDIVEPYLSTLMHNGYFTSTDNVNLYYEQYLLPKAKAHIVISHGFTETSQKYKEVIYYFLKAGYSVHIIDHRGHGFSDRMIDTSSKVYVKHFTDYVTDFKLFMDKVVLPTSDNSPCFLYGHSMGGCIGGLFLEHYPQYFKAAILSSPMMAIDTDSYPVLVAGGIAKIATLLGQGETYIFGQGDFKKELNFEDASSDSRVRYTYYFNKKLSNPLLQLGGGTFSWLNSSFNATREITKVKNAKKVVCPILVFQAENDTLVRPEGHYAFVKAAPLATLIQVPNAKHELFFAENNIMIPYFNTIFDFIEKNK